jgi:hypothetical protein
VQLERALEKFLTQLAADGRAHATAEQYARHIRALVRWLTAADRPNSGRVPRALQHGRRAN